MPSKGACITRSWTLLYGYTLQLIPLIIKLYATNKVFQASKKLRRVQIDKKRLFGLVCLIMLLSTIYLTCWTIIDPFTVKTKYQLEDQSNQIEVQYLCASNSAIWNYVSLGWNFTLLLCAVMLAF